MRIGVAIALLLAPLRPESHRQEARNVYVNGTLGVRFSVPADGYEMRTSGFQRSTGKVAVCEFESRDKKVRGDLRHYEPKDPVSAVQFAADREDDYRKMKGVSNVRRTKETRLDKKSGEWLLHIYALDYDNTDCRYVHLYVAQDRRLLELSFDLLAADWEPYKASLESVLLSLEVSAPRPANVAVKDGSYVNRDLGLSFTAPAASYTIRTDGFINPWRGQICEFTTGKFEVTGIVVQQDLGLTAAAYADMREESWRTGKSVAEFRVLGEKRRGDRLLRDYAVKTTDGAEFRYVHAYMVQGQGNIEFAISVRERDWNAYRDSVTRIIDTIRLETRREEGATTRITTAGGSLALRGAKFDFPARCVADERDVTVNIVSDPPAPRNRNLKLVSAAFALDAGRMQFDKAITITIPFDPARLPTGARSEDAFPVIGRAGEYEPLRARRVDPAKREITFEIDRLLPRISHCAPARAALDGQTVFGVAGEIERLEAVAADADIDLHATGAMKERALACLPVLRATLARAKREFGAMGFPPMTAPIRVGLVPFDRINAAGQACGDDLVYLDEMLAKPDDYELASAFTHECFHLVQNASNRGLEMTTFSPILDKWPDESSADWIQYKLYPRSAFTLGRAATIRPDLFAAAFFEPHNDLNDPYRGFTFWCFLEQERIDVPGILKRFYVDRKTDSKNRTPAPDTVHHLEAIFRARGGRPLADCFIDYLIRTCWKKDYPPFSTMGNYAPKLAESLGKPGELKYDRASVVAWDFPWNDGRERKRQKAFAPAESKAFGIVTTYVLSSKTKEGEKGNLDVRLDGPRGKARMVVFPFGSGGVRNPMIGEAGSIVTLANWETLGGAIVWVVDLSVDGGHHLGLTAGMKGRDSTDPEKAIVGDWIGTVTCTKSTSKSVKEGVINTRAELRIRREEKRWVLSSYGTVESSKVRVNGRIVTMEFGTVGDSVTLEFQCDDDRLTMTMTGNGFDEDGEGNRTAMSVVYRGEYRRQR